MRNLDKYNQKRNFDKTNEPVGKVKNKRKRKIFTVQFHRARKEHYDFRLEWDGVLLSWAVPKGPSFNPKDKRLAVQTEDHPIDYADFEGVIPKGEYGGGSVLLWDFGWWEEQDDFDKGLRDGSLKFILHGKRLNGRWALVRLKKQNEKENNWLLLKEKDDYAKNETGIEDFVTSVKTGRTSKEIIAQEDLSKKTNPFESVKVQLASLSGTIPKGKDWLFEVKYDGYRIVSFVEHGKVRLVSRNGRDYTKKLSQIALEMKNLFQERAIVLDGEMIAVDEKGKSDFQSLQNFVKTGESQNLVYMIFDLLALDGEDLRNLPLIERKKKLQELLSSSSESLCFSQYVIGNGEECFEAVRKLGMEGIVGKKINSFYKGERNEDWIKIKCRREQEFVVGGFSRTNKNKNGISALLVGYFECGKFLYCGKVGTGIRESDAKELLKKFKQIEKCPFDNEVMQGDDEIFWVEPEIVVASDFAEFTKDGLLRQASFKGVRTDKNAKEVVLEREIDLKKEDKQNFRVKDNAVAGVEISNPDKLIFDDCKVKKIDVARYYEKVASRMLQYVSGRVLSVVRCHDGVGSGCFFKKHPNTQIDGEKIVAIKNDERESSDYFYIQNVKGLIGEVQLGTVEFHVWGSKVEALELPDMMVFDLDPDEKLKIDDIRQGVKDLKKILDELSLKSFLKTSGGKGYHVVVPFKPSASWESFHDFAEKVAVAMENKWPERYTSNIRKDSRKGKIFIDWVRNGRGATSVAPYSLRARKGAKVSMPIFWKELDSVTPTDFDIYSAVDRLKKKDPWAGFYDVKQKLKV